MPDMPRLLPAARCPLQLWLDSAWTASVLPEDGSVPEAKGPSAVVPMNGWLLVRHASLSRLELATTEKKGLILLRFSTNVQTAALVYFIPAAIQHCWTSTSANPALSSPSKHSRCADRR